MKDFVFDYVKCLLSGILIVSSGMLFSQAGGVGIKTATPQRTLHVNGSLQVTNEINVGGTATKAGEAGLNNQVLVSQGPGNSVAWKDVNSLLAPSNTYALKLFNEFITKNLTIPSGSANVSLLLGTLSGVTISNPNNLVIIYMDIDTYSYQLFNQSAIAYSFISNISQDGTEIAVQNTGALILNGSVFTDSRNGNFRSFVYRNLPVGTINVGMYTKRFNSQGPNGNKDLTFLPGNVHVYVYEKS